MMIIMTPEGERKEGRRDDVVIKGQHLDALVLLLWLSEEGLLYPWEACRWWWWWWWW